VKSPSGYRWFALGDVNGFFGLLFDNMAVLSFLAAILIHTFDFPADIVYKRMFPGTAAGVLFGDVVYTWMAFRLARKSGKKNVTAMPLGLDTPSTIGIALAVLGPAFVAMKQQGMDPRQAAMMTWYIGMATMVMTGIFKLVMSFCGSWIQRIVPRAGLLGSLAGIGLALIGFMPLVDIFSLPVIGMISLGLIFYTVIARIRLPGRLPGVLLAIVVGTTLYHILGPNGWLVGSYKTPVLDFHMGLPLPTLGFVKGFIPALKYLPIALPFAILTVVGGINVTESARVSGDNYNTRNILLTEALATLVAGICGGVAQSTPYIGQPAYKRLGARAGYTLLTGIFIGLGGMLGYISFFVALIPRAVLAPILVFVALDITAQAFMACENRHAPAVALAIFPAISRLLAIQYGNTALVPTENLTQLMTAVEDTLPPVLVEISLGNGFIVTGMLWGAFLCEMIDRRLKRSSAYLAVLAVLSFFGVIHSATITGNMYLPWNLQGVTRDIPYLFAGAYLILALLMFALSFSRSSSKPAVEDIDDMAIE
jgi:AGZA family xanthine/uracil permease-like MFS transporter